MNLKKYLILLLCFSYFNLYTNDQKSDFEVVNPLLAIIGTACIYYSHYIKYQDVNFNYLDDTFNLLEASEKLSSENSEQVKYEFYKCLIKFIYSMHHLIAKKYLLLFGLILVNKGFKVKNIDNYIKIILARNLLSHT